MRYGVRERVSWVEAARGPEESGESERRGATKAATRKVYSSESSNYCACLPTRNIYSQHRTHTSQWRTRTIRTDPPH